MHTFSVWHWLILLGIPSIAVIAILWSSLKDRKGENGPSGLGGWLGLLGFLIGASPFLTLAGLFEELTNHGYVLNYKYGKYLFIELVLLNSAIVIIEIIMLVLFLKESKIFPKFFLGLWLFIPMFNILHAYFISEIQGIQMRDILIDYPVFQESMRFLYTGVWVLYVTRSIRARNTFVRPSANSQAV